MAENRTGIVLDGLLGRIRSGEWPPGYLIPPERDLMEEFRVSRVPVREALAHLRALGIIETRQGSGTRVRRVDVQTIARLLPLLVTLEGPRTFGQVFELRIPLETRAAWLAARRCSEEDGRALRELVERFRSELDSGLETAVRTDLAFHVRIAEATGNPLFGVLMRALSELILHAQFLGCKDDPERRRRAVVAHESIAEAVLARDPERAAAEMEAHLRYSAGRFPGGIS